MSFQYGLYPVRGLSIPTGFCNVPTGLVCTLNGDIAKFDWTAPHDVLYYNLTVYKDIAGTLTKVLDVNVTSTSYTFQFDPNTLHHWHVQSICSLSPALSSTLTSGPDFTTGAHVIKCMAINITDVVTTLDIDKTMLSWPAQNSAVGYYVYFKQKGLILPFEVKSTQTNSITIEGLTSNKTYEYYVRTICSDGSTSDSLHGTFLTPVDNDICPKPLPRIALNGTTAVMVWDAGNTPFFDIFLNGSLIISNYPGNLYTFNNLTPNTDFIASVIGKCLGGNSVAGSVPFKTLTSGCPPVINIHTPVINNGIATLDWDAVAGADGYKVVIDGSVINVDVPEVMFAVLPGSRHHIIINTLCLNGSMSTQPATYDFVAPFSCPAILIGSVSVSAWGAGFDLDWPDLPGVVSYQYRYKLSSDSTFTPWTDITQSFIEVTGLLPSATYNIDIKSICVDGTTSVLNLNVNTNALINGQKPVITLINSITDSFACILFTLPDGTGRGTFDVEVTNTDTSFVGIVSGSGRETTTICLPDFAQHTHYSIRVRQRKAGTNPVWSDPYPFQTCWTPIPLTGISAVFNSSGDIVITWTPDNSTSYEVWSQDLSIPGQDFKKEGTTTLGTYTITGNAFKYRNIQIKSFYSPSYCPGYTTSIVVACPKVNNLQALVEGNSIKATWDPIPGAYGYRVTITSLQTGSHEELTLVPSILVDDLEPLTSYSIQVSARCTPELAGPSSDAIVAVTGNSLDMDNGCLAPEFTATVQPSSLTNSVDDIEVDNTDPAVIHYTTSEGASFDRSAILKDGQSNPINLTGYSFDCAVKDENGNTVLQFLSSDGSIINGGVNGTVAFNKNATEMAALTVGTYTYVFNWTTPLNVTKPIIEGTITVNP